MDFGGDLWKVVSSYCSNITVSTTMMDSTDQAAIQDGIPGLLSPSVSAQNDWYGCNSPGSANGEGNVYYDELFDVYRIVPESNAHPFNVSLNPIPQANNFQADYDHVQYTQPKEVIHGVDNGFLATNSQPINGVPLYYVENCGTAQHAVPCTLLPCPQPEEEEEEEEEENFGNIPQPEVDNNVAAKNSQPINEVQIYDEQHALPCTLTCQHPKEEKSFEDVIPEENRRNLNVERCESFRFGRRRNRDIKEFEVKAENLLLVDNWDWLHCGKAKSKGSKYDKLYYKCCNFNTMCQAKKHVQRKDVADEEEIYIISYVQKHNHDEPTQCNASTGTSNHNKRKRSFTQEPSGSHPQTSVSSSTTRDRYMDINFASESGFGELG